MRPEGLKCKMSFSVVILSPTPGSYAYARMPLAVKPCCHPLPKKCSSFLGSGPSGTMSCRIQGIFCPSICPYVRTSVPPLLGQGQCKGPHARAPRQRTLGQGLQARAPWPGPPGQGPQASTLRGGPPGQSLRPRAPSQGLHANAPKPPGQCSQASRYDKMPNKWTDGRTDIWTDKISPVFYRTSSLWDRCPAHNQKICNIKKSRAIY